MRDLHESWMSHELFGASWNAYYKVDLSSEHVCSCYQNCFFHLLLGCMNGKMCEKRRVCFKTSWVNVDKGASAECVVFKDVRAGPCRLATRRCLVENKLLR